MAILGFTGQAKEIDISDFWLNDATGSPAYKYSSWWAEKGNSLLFFNEAQNVTLSQNIKISDPQDWDDLNNLGTIPKGTVVDSHFIYMNNANTSTRKSFTATFTFDKPIIGFMADDELFGNASTLQPLNGNDQLVGYHLCDRRTSSRRPIYFCCPNCFIFKPCNAELVYAIAINNTITS
jgi:hypothetical protein